MKQEVTPKKVFIRTLGWLMVTYRGGTMERIAISIAISD